MFRRRMTIVSLMSAVALTAMLAPAKSHAMPNFAREYGKDCGMCHTQVPKLNRKGYEFRMAGFRFPDEIGEKEDPNELDLADVFAARLQMKYTYKDHDDVDPANDSSSSQLEFHEFTMYPLTGSWGGNFASMTEFSMAPDESFEIENAFVRGVYGDADGFWEARLGIVHSWEGFGASDRVIGLSRPLFQTARATGSPYFLWSLDEMVVEVGYYLAKSGTSITGSVGNGILWKEDGSGQGEPAQGGDLSKSGGLPSQDAKSYRLNLTQFINDESSVTLFYYTTEVPSPNPFGADGTPLPGPFTQDRIERVAAYANYYVLPKKLNLLAGYAQGSDDLDDPALAPTVGDSDGWFGEVDWFPVENLAVGARYDKFDPSDNVDHNSQDAWSVFANYRAIAGLQFVGEYQQKKTEAGATPGENSDDQFQLRVVFTW